MDIAIDARELAGRPTGVGRYLAQLLTRWQVTPAAARHRFTLFAHAPVEVPHGPLPLDVTVLPGRGGTRWEQATLPAALRRRRPDVLFAPGYSAPLLSPAPTVLSVHDVSFAAHPEWFRPREGLRRRIVTRASAQRAALVLTLSEFSRQEIVRRLHVRASGVRVIPLGLGVVGDAPLPVVSGPRPPVILYVGSVFNRRHLPEVIRALPRVRAMVPGARLVIVGENRTWPAQDLAAVAAHAGVADHVELTAFVDDRRLRALYEGASAFVFLSEYEGLGLTPLEALAHGVPAVVLDTQVAREAYGEAVLRVPAPDPPLVAEQLIRLMTDPAARQAILDRAPSVLRRYSWADAASATLAALEEAGRG